MGRLTSTQLLMMPSKRSMTPLNLAQLVIRNVSRPNCSPRKMPRDAKASDKPASSQATGKPVNRARMKTTISAIASHS